MEIARIVAVGIVCAVLVVYLNSVGKEYGFLAGIASSVLLLTMSLSYVVRFVRFFSDLSDTTGISSDIVALVIKILGISYLIEFPASLIEKVVFAGKLVIFALSVPVAENVISVVMKLL